MDYSPIARILFFVAFIFLQATIGFGQRHLNSGIKVKVVPDPVVAIHFDHPLREWHGFGVNYVEACQTRDYDLFQQDYSGFSFATEEAKRTIMELVWGADGLRPALTKLFLDPFHEGKTRAGNDNDDPMDIDLAGYDHETTTRHMRYFNTVGQEMMKTWGGTMQALVTLYAPAPWMTRQGYVLGRDLAETEKAEVAEYMASWAKFLIEREGLPVKYLSFHNEGDAYYRWPRDGSNPGEDHRDYNSYWTPDQVVEFLKLTRRVLDANGLEQVGLTPGETQTWFRFDQWGYASAIYHDQEALNNLALMTSHSFAFLDEPQSVYYGDYRSIGQDLIHQKKPEIPVWVTSRPWTSGPDFVENFRRDIYESKANGIIPWALIAGAKQWLQTNGEYADGSMDKAFVIGEDGELTVTKNYFYYKQVTRAGQPGRDVVEVISYDPAIGVIAFEGEGSHMVLTNKSDKPKDVRITLHNATSRRFEAFRTSNTEDYEGIGIFEPSQSHLAYTAPPRSVTTFFGK
ncbi:MAG: hypothetical protein AAGA85_00735 [Bacteroidota bacterium]